ncbi:Phage protein [Desulfosporosinus sp. I2]|nr:Phage protein [Desulfosporosinus sp. I2]
MLASDEDNEEQEDEDSAIEEEHAENKEDEEYVNVIQKAIDLNHRMLFDLHIRNFLVNQARRIWRGLLLGRAYIKGNYMYAAGDTIAFMEHAFGSDVIGFLGENQLFCAGKKGEHIILRNPLTHYSEVLKAEFTESENKYIKYLDNVCQFPAACDLSMARLNLDFDGDKVMVINNPVMRRKHVPADVIYDPGDKSTADALDYNIDSILAYELMNLDNLTGRVTNIDTYFSNKAMERNEGLESRDFETTICKYLQGQIIDSVKSMKKVSIPEELNAVWKKPYFLHHKYGDYKTNPKAYQGRDDAKSPFNKFVIILENFIKDFFEINFGDIIDIDYLDVQDTKTLLQDNSKCDSETFYKIIRELQPIYKEYIKQKEELAKKGKGINSLDKSDEIKEELRQLNEEYKKFYDDIKSKCREICSNESVLASCCIEITYNYTKNKNDSGFKRNQDYTFPWRIVPEGVLENLKRHEDKNKIDVKEVRELNHLEREFKGQLKVKDGIGVISDVQIKTSLKDGDYHVYNILGQHFTDSDVEREEAVKCTQSEAPPVNEDAGVKPLADYTVKLIKLEGKAPEYLIEKMNLGLILKMRNTDVAIYSEDEYLASVRKEDVNPIGQAIRLTDYINEEFSFDEVIEISESKKSLIIKMSTI